MLTQANDLESGIDFSQAIMTTDTVMKNTTYATIIDGKEVHRFRDCKRFRHD